MLSAKRIIQSLNHRIYGLRIEEANDRVFFSDESIKKLSDRTVAEMKKTNISIDMQLTYLLRLFGLRSFSKVLAQSSREEM
mmetsp:Transcript_23055/g.32484  ORF Transcript_23055/g.32484 Transcript_23055/m.32484 type:complete len:81 (+) Transcript_23055:158-400(+)